MQLVNYMVLEEIVGQDFCDGQVMGRHGNCDLMTSCHHIVMMTHHTITAMQFAFIAM